MNKEQSSAAESHRQTITFKKTVYMLAGVIIMGICVALLKITQFGPDPFSAINYGIARILGLTFGTWELIINGIEFVIIFIIDRTLLGLGSFGNMIVVGYSADFTSWVILRFFNITVVDEMWLRLVIMIPALLIFVLAAALYMNCGLGSGPYDATAFLIHRCIHKKMGDKTPSFRFVRILYDGLFTLGAILIQGEWGLVTIASVFTLGPAVEWVGKKLKL